MPIDRGDAIQASLEQLREWLKDQSLIEVDRQFVLTRLDQLTETLKELLDITP